MRPLRNVTYGEDALVDSYLKKKDDIRYEYRRSLANRIKNNSYRVEINLLKFDGHYRGDRTSDVKNRYFYCPTNNSSAVILKSMVVEGTRKPELQKEIMKVLELKDPTEGAFCHYPIHGMRIIFDDESFESIEMSLCWFCQNIGFAYPDGDQYLDTTPELESLVKSLLPIPESEFERFNDRKRWEEEKDAPEDEEDSKREDDPIFK